MSFWVFVVVWPILGDSRPGWPFRVGLSFATGCGFGLFIACYFALSVRRHKIPAWRSLDVRAVRSDEPSSTSPLPLPKLRPQERVALIAVSIVLLVQFGSWFAVARHNLRGHAWALWTLRELRDTPQRYLPDCVAVEPALHASTPPRLLSAVRRSLAERSVDFRVSPPTHDPFYLDRDCLEIWHGPEEWRGSNFPFLASPTVAYYNYDSNGDSVLLLQVGPRWLYLTHSWRWI